MTGPHSNTAPALIALAHGSRDPRSAATIQATVAAVRTLRPQLRIEAAFLDLCDPLFADCVDHLVGAGHNTIVVVPLLLVEAFHATADVPAALAAASRKHRGLSISAAPILGLDTTFLAVLNRRLDRALQAHGSASAEALVLAAAGSSSVAANQAVAAFAQQWGNQRELPVLAAYAAGSEPDPGAAVAALRAQGHRDIGVGSLFLAPGRLPDRAERLALESGAIAVAAPLGPATEVATAILARFDTMAAFSRFAGSGPGARPDRSPGSDRNR